MRSKREDYLPAAGNRKGRGHLSFKPDVPGGCLGCAHSYRLLLDGGNDSGCYIPDGESVAKAVEYAFFWMRQKLIWTAMLEVSNASTGRVTDTVALTLADNRKKQNMEPIKRKTNEEDRTDTESRGGAVAADGPADRHL